MQWAAEACSKLEFCLCAKTKFSPWLALLQQKNLHIGEAATSKKRRFHFLFKGVVFITLPSAKYALDKVQVRLEKEVLAKLILSVYFFFFLAWRNSSLNHGESVWKGYLRLYSLLVLQLRISWSLFVLWATFYKEHYVLLILWKLLDGWKIRSVT